MEIEKIKKENLVTEKIKVEEGESQKRVKPTNDKKTARIKREQEERRRRYFDYYDDIKTNIKQDW